ncbi:hypothetical protein L348_07560 [Enterobacter sp. MGH 2]|nr:hypothetical protein L354_01117 [Enterobacter sp. MGH 8]ESN11098.1 hypothetical protein L372_01321 [Enterobacter sp. MGH 26]EUM34454.1 hypothetical protein L407_03113 [Enterobacter sp. BWH 39]EUM64459.1 hypothetical protein L358_01750 [Enterobacter sp. MGH 12]EUM65729.1 hypothetical protein L357_03160 [Enterobacter sp. MGH 11]EUM76394.1 hypothetical protein L355_06539 [Enterobacter sp. MGH 9]EUM94524.1 hypothetical protein L351_06549 [Enterobacter sp. MGH 5]EUN03651.1 hypothetical protein
MHMTIRMMLRHTSLTGIRVAVGMLKPMIFLIRITPTW